MTDYSQPQTDGYRSLGKVLVTKDGKTWTLLEDTRPAGMWDNIDSKINEFYIPLGKEIGNQFWHMNPFTGLDEKKVVIYLTYLSATMERWKSKIRLPNFAVDQDEVYYIYIGNVEPSASDPQNNGMKDLFIELKLNTYSPPINSVKVVANEGYNAENDDAYNAIVKYDDVYERTEGLTKIDGGKRKSKKSKKYHKKSKKHHKKSKKHHKKSKKYHKKSKKHHKK